MTLDLWKAPITHASHNGRQLLQMAPTQPIENRLADGTFTGRGAIGLGENRELSYGCVAR